MTKWELTMLCVDVTHISYPDPKKIWADKDKKTGKSTWDDLKELAADGWELVSVVPLSATHGITCMILYTLKRPLS